MKAIGKRQLEFATAGISIVTCSSIMGNLCRFVCGDAKSFRFVLERVGNTVFFIRRENSPTDLIPDVHGYGHNFVDEYTAWGAGLAGSESHQRIIEYDFGGCHFLVRFESDGYIPGEVPDTQNDRTTPDIDQLADLLHRNPGSNQNERAEGLALEKGGRVIPQEKVIDIKTRSMFDAATRTFRKEIDLTDILLRLWVSQIPTLVVAYHRRGLFEDIQIRDMREAVAQWERDKEEQLRKLTSLIHDLVEYARSSRTRLEVCRTHDGPCEIRRVAENAPEALSPEYRDAWLKMADGSALSAPKERVG